MALNSVSWCLVLALQLSLLGQHGVLCFNLNVTAIFAFGDSTIDPGNNNWVDTVAKANFPPYGVDFPGGKATGRFCNGKVIPDLLSEYFKLKPIVPAILDPDLTVKDFSTGASFASSGSGFYEVTSATLNSIHMEEQLRLFKNLTKNLHREYGAERAEEIISQALYVISGGSNDFIMNWFINGVTKAKFKDQLEKYQEMLLEQTESFIVKLHSYGARNIAFSGISPLGCPPIVRTMNLLRMCKGKQNEAAKKHNDKLEGLLKELNDTLKGVEIVFTNPYDILESLYLHPRKYGFEVADKGCCASGFWEMGKFCDRKKVCDDRSKYFFFDSVHPTERGNKVVVEHLITQILPDGKRV